MTVELAPWQPANRYPTNRCSLSGLLRTQATALLRAWQRDCGLFTVSLLTRNNHVHFDAAQTARQPLRFIQQRVQDHRYRCAALPAPRRHGVTSRTTTDGKLPPVSAGRSRSRIMSAGKGVSAQRRKSSFSRFQFTRSGVVVVVSVLVRWSVLRRHEPRLLPVVGFCQNGRADKAGCCSLPVLAFALQLSLPAC